MENKDIAFIRVSDCPICGERPDYIKESLDYGNGHGYPGKYDLSYKCPRCGLIHSTTFHTIYDSEEVVKNTAKKDWNQKCNVIRSYILERYLDKK